jgi:uncharacterized membrane protein
MDGFLRVVTTTAAIGAALVGGVLLAFSSFVMPALRRVAPVHGLRSMQAINLEAPRAGFFMVPFMGTALLSAGLAAVGVARVDEPYGGYLLAGGALYLACVAITAVYHVPRNDALAEVDPGDGGASSAWARYQPGWTRWNHVRVAAAAAGAVAFVLALGAD